MNELYYNADLKQINPIGNSSNYLQSSDIQSSIVVNKVIRHESQQERYTPGFISTKYNFKSHLR